MATHLDILNRLISEKLVAVVRLDSGDQLIKVAEALKAGGITAIEFTVPTPNSLEMIKQAAVYFGDEVLMGAGTVLDPETARSAILSGAQFIVTPALNIKTIELCRRYGKPIIPGAMTPTEILTAWEAGADMVKVFPADILGSAYLKAVLAPLPQIRLVPTGGISSENAAEYLKAGATAVGVGGKLVSKSAVANGDWAAITAEAQRLVHAVHQAVS
ncbi:MAG: bifunctional 4-hydroxy-2-oxoglutarate aldolase/2-dehydro-3-deoxy-phosphogluconate aldolase [Anaerolineaceae bacterium]